MERDYKLGELIIYYENLEATPAVQIFSSLQQSSKFDFFIHTKVLIMLFWSNALMIIYNHIIQFGFY